jgi:2-polyprenyl-6-hydroxyphenyl methylase/3-demethylubiquinone-9 3-methyltransferase
MTSTRDAVSSGKGAVNNAVYDTLGRRWYEAEDDPIALLRAESRARNPWILKLLRERGLQRVLDLGCGGGFLSHYLSQSGLTVTGLDASLPSLEVAKERDPSERSVYLQGDARALPFPDQAFDSVCAMDFLEHVDEVSLVLREAARVLRPGGLFFFHTFNRNWLSRLVVIRGVEWFVKNTPEGLHVYRNFIRPDELKATLASSGLELKECFGFGPRFLQWPLIRLLFTGRVSRNFRFERKKSLALGYAGFAVKK